MSADPPSDLLGRPVVHTYKDDARSTVWRCEDDAGRAWVIKRFNAGRRAQSWRRALRCHPADRERRWDRQLSGNKVPVVPIAGGGVDAAGRSWLVTAYAGPSLHQQLVDGALGQVRLRQRLAREAGAVTGVLLGVAGVSPGLPGAEYGDGRRRSRAARG